MVTDFRALCAELLQAMDEITEYEIVDWGYVKSKPLKMADKSMEEARAALAAEPVGEGLSDAMQRLLASPMDTRGYVDLRHPTPATQSTPPTGSHTMLFKFQPLLKLQMKPDYRSMCEKLLKHLEWYIEEDDTNEGEENEYWLKGKRDAMEVVSKTKKVFLENPQ